MRRRLAWSQAAERKIVRLSLQDVVRSSHGPPHAQAMRAAYTKHDPLWSSVTEGAISCAMRYNQTITRKSAGHAKEGRRGEEAAQSWFSAGADSGDAACGRGAGAGGERRCAVGDGGRARAGRRGLLGADDSKGTSRAV